MGRKRKARKMREESGVAYVSDDFSKITDKPQYEGHEPSTHLMADSVNEKGNRFYVWPSISPGPLGKYHAQSFEEAAAKGELFKFRNEKRAQKFAWGSWKKGEAKKQAMRDYREHHGKWHPHIEETSAGKNITSWKSSKNKMVMKEKEVIYRTKDNKREVYKHKEVIKNGKTTERKKLKKGLFTVKKYKDKW